MANVFDLVKGDAHVVAESSRLKATTAGHIYDLEMIKDTDNGTIVCVGDLSDLGVQVFKAKNYVAGETPYLILTPPLAYNGKKVWSDEKYFYNAKGEVARAYELHKDDIFTVSANAFTGDVAVGNLVDSGYAVIESAGEGFVGEIIEEVTYTNGTSYRIIVRKI